jgi:arylsulfatase
MDPHEDLQVTNYASVEVNGFRMAEEYLASVKKFPNPPAANVTNFRQR